MTVFNTQAYEYKNRRQLLMAKTGPDSVIVLPAASMRVRNRDVHFPYRQESNFYYLSGFAEPEAVLMLIPGRKEGEYLLFCRDRDPEKEIWDGYRAGTEGACAIYGADEAHPIAEIDKLMPDLLTGKKRLFYEIGSN